MIFGRNVGHGPFRQSSDGQAGVHSKVFRNHGAIHDSQIGVRINSILHIDDRFIETGRVNTAAMRPIARLGYSEYATVTEAWRMRRPS